MATDRPSPMDLLSQLAENVVRQIDADSRNRFQTALNELTDYHRFLLEAYSTTSSDGSGESYARIRAGWRATYQDWLSVYYDIIDRAITKLDGDSDFVKTLAYLPMRLLPRGQEFGSPEATNDILNLESTLVYRLERWLASKTIVLPESATTVSVNRGAASPSAYDEALKAIVSAWETIQNIGPGRKTYETIQDPALRWRKMGASWSYHFRHLQTAAEMLVVATWYSDKTGVARFRDLLIRWRSNIEADQASSYLFEWTPFLNADLLEVGWDKVVQRLEGIRFLSPSPDAVFKLILDRVHSDVMLLVAAIFIQWTLAGKQAPLAADSAVRLLSREVLEPRELRFAAAERRINERTLDLFELYLSGSRFDSRSYGATLDALISVLDRVSERPVQSGRPYTPSTAHGRDSLIGAYVVLLLESFEPSRMQTVGEQLRAFIANEDRLPQGDRTLIDLLSFVQTLDRIFVAPLNGLTEAVNRLKPNLDVNAAVPHLKAFLAEIRVEVDRVRSERIKAREIDPEKIERLQTAVDEQLLQGYGQIRYFHGFTISRSQAEIAATQVYFNNMDKNEFVRPPIETVSSNFFDVISEQIAIYIANLVLFEFLKRPRVQAIRRSPCKYDGILESGKGAGCRGRRHALHRTAKSRDRRVFAGISIRHQTGSGSRYQTAARC